MFQGGSLPRNDTGVSMVMTSKHPEPYISIAAQALVQDHCHVHCGMVRKENKIKKWQDRYLILHKGCLYYYKDSNDKKAQGQFSLSGYRMNKAPEKTKHDWTFKLTHIQPEKRAYHFAAHSARELNEWMDKIQEDMVEYCEIRRPHANTGESNNSSEENDEKYDYPLVIQEEMDKLKERIIKESKTKGSPIPFSTDATYSPAEELFNVSSSATPIATPPRPHAGFNSTPSKLPSKILGVSPGQSSVDISKLLGKGPVGSGNVIGNQAALNLSTILTKSSPLPKVPQRNRPNDHSTGSSSPQVNHRPAPKPQPKPKPRKATSSASSSLSSLDSINSEDMYLELNNEDAEMQRLPTMQRNRPDGNSFKSKDNNVQEARPESRVLPQSALRLDLNKSHAIPLLIGYDGAYMIHSSRKGDSQVLSVCVRDRIKHFIIFCKKDEDQYSLIPDGPYFTTVEIMLQHYYEKPLPNQASTALLRIPYT